MAIISIYVYRKVIAKPAEPAGGQDERRIRRMCLWLVPFGYGISGTVGIFALNIIIGGLIGGLALIVGLLLGIIHTI